MAEILKVNNVKNADVNISKGVGSLVFYLTENLQTLDKELISLQIERNGQSNIEITQGYVSLKRLLLCATYGSDAIFSSPEFKTCAVVELAEMGSISLGQNDKLKISLKELDPNITYVIDGHEEPANSKEIFLYEEKIIPADQKNYDVNVAHYDTLVLDDDSNIQELNFTHDNNVVTKHTLREARAIATDVDPLAYIDQDGKSYPSIEKFIQLPIKGLISVNVRKEEGTVVHFFMRKDVDLVQLGLI